MYAKQTRTHSPLTLSNPRKENWAFPLNKENHALAIMLDLVEARQMALAALDVIQTWQTVNLLREWGVIGEQTLVPSEPRQLTLLEAVG